MIRSFIATVLFLGFTNASTAQLKWPACEHVFVGGFDVSGVGPGIMYRSECREHMPEKLDELFKGTTGSFARKRLELESVWTALKSFPPRVFEYRLIIGSYDSAIDVLINDVEPPDREMGFLSTPYTRLAKSLTFHVPACRKMTLTFYSPWPPQRRAVQVEWLETAPVGDSWSVQSAWATSIATPGSWGGNPAAAQRIFYADADQPKIQALDEEDLRMQRCKTAQ